MAGNEVVVENETNVDTAVTVESLVVPAAVFTATLGCNWTRLPDFVTELDARNSKKLVMGLLQERGIELVPGRIVKGVLYRGEYAVAFSLQQVTGWDQAGRDADYYACAFIKDDLIGKIDFERLLQHDYFVRPVEDPRAEIDCSGMIVSEVSYERCLNLFNAIHGEGFDWRELGVLLHFAGVAASQWLMASVSIGKNSITYSKCENWDEAVVSRVRSTLLSSYEPANNQESGDGDLPDDGVLQVTGDEEKSRSEPVGVQSADVCNLQQEEYLQEEAYRQELQQQNEELKSEKTGLAMKVRQLERDSGLFRSQLKEQGQQYLELDEKYKQAKKENGDLKLMMVVIGLLAFLLGMCVMAVISVLVKMI